MSNMLLTFFFLVVQAVENVVLLIKCSLAFCDLMSCVWHVVSHQQHMTHVLTSPWTWNQIKAVLQRQCQSQIILAMARQIP